MPLSDVEAKEVAKNYYLGYLHKRRHGFQLQRQRPLFSKQHLVIVWGHPYLKRKHLLKTLVSFMKAAFGNPLGSSLFEKKVH